MRARRNGKIHPAWIAHQRSQPDRTALRRTSILLILETNGPVRAIAKRLVLRCTAAAQRVVHLRRAFVPLARVEVHAAHFIWPVLNDADRRLVLMMGAEMIAEGVPKRA